MTLGSLRIEGLDWRPAKALTLLAYLDLQGPTSRRRLRELFWPEAQDPGASLRVLLGQLRKQLPGVLKGEETLETALTTDASILLQAGERGEGVFEADLYVGPFLAGVDLNEVSEELNEWVLETRERLAGAARLAAIRAAEVAGSPAEAGQWAERAAAIQEAPPMETDLLERLLRLALPGSLLESELRRELAEFGGGEALHLSPVQEQELLGRERELDALLLALSDPATRLIEITGSGGIGKSTLAAAVLREQADLSGVQVLSIPLETASASSEAAARMVVALKLQVIDRGDGWLALARAWADRPLLVLLDGAEGLADLGRGIETLLTHCKGVRVIVTSRIHRLSGAVHLALDGLSVPSAGESPERVARSAAAQLFVRGARRYVAGFTLDAQSAPLVSAIVRRLGGHPLATVLSATWMRVYPPAQIHTQILQDLTALRAESGTSERHQLNAVFERSWQLLTPEEAQATSALAVFQGFTPAAALAVAGVTTELLERLSTHSLLRELRPDTQGQRRLEVPPVLAAQAQAHLPDAAAVQDAHAAYYLNHLMSHAPESEEVNSERANIVAAIGHAVSQGRDVSAQIDVLLASYDRRGLLDSGTDAFHMLKEALKSQDSVSAGSVLVGMAWLALLASRYTDADFYANHILTNVERYDQKNIMKALNITANSLRRRGKFSESLKYLMRALEMAIRSHDIYREQIYKLNISEIHMYLGEYEKSLKILEEFVLNENTDSEVMKMYINTHRICVDYYSKSIDLVTIRAEVEVFLERFKAYKYTPQYLLILLFLPRLVLALGHPESAQPILGTIHKLLEQAPLQDVKIAASIVEVEVLYALGQSGRARQHASAALRMCSQVGEEQGYYEIFLSCAADLDSLNHETALQALSHVVLAANRTDYQRLRAQTEIVRIGGIVSVQLLPLQTVVDHIQRILTLQPTIG